MRSFCPPQPSPPDAGGEGVTHVTGFSNHKAFSGSTFSLSPNGGEGQGEGEVSFSEQRGR